MGMSTKFMDKMQTKTDNGQRSGSPIYPFGATAGPPPLTGRGAQHDNKVSPSKMTQ